MEPNISEVGSTTNNTVSESKSGAITPNTKATTRMAKSKASATSNGTMAPHTWATSTIMIFKVLASTSGPIKEYMKETGDQTECMAKVVSPGPTVADT